MVMVIVTAIIRTARIGLEITHMAGMAGMAAQVLEDLEHMEHTGHTAGMQTKTTTLRVEHTMATSEEEEEAGEDTDEITCVIDKSAI